MQAVIFGRNYDFDSSVFGSQVFFGLLPVGGKPLLAHMMEQLVFMGVKDVVLLLGEGAYPVYDYAGNGERWGVSLGYCPVRKNDGFLAALKKIGAGLRENFILVNGYALFSMDLNKAFEEHVGRRSIISLHKAYARSSGLMILNREVLKVDSPAGMITAAEVVGEASARGLRVDELPPAEPFVPVCDLKTLKAAHVMALNGEMPFLRIPGREISGGVRVGRECRIDPGAELVAPLILADFVRVEAGCRVGPYVFAGSGTIVEKGAEISGSIILDGTFIGEGTTLTDCLTAKSVFVNLEDGLAVRVPDAFILGDAWEAESGGLFEGIVHAVVAACLAVLLSPLILACFLAHFIMPGRGIRYSREMACSLSKPDLGGNEEVMFLKLPFFSSPNMFIARIPWLFRIIRGDLRLVGVQPLTRGQLENLPDDWRKDILRAPAGLVQPWHAIKNGHELDETEKEVMEIYYAKTRCAAEDVRIFVRGLIRGLRAKSSAAPE